MGIGLTIRAKGVSGLTARVGTVASRFGITPGPMARRLHAYADITEEAGAHPTLPVTACVLARHPALIRDLVDRGVEFAIHGLVHNDHSGLAYATQYTSMVQAADLFRAAGVPYAGFRGPYLGHNEATEEAARAVGLAYHSSQAVAYPVLPTPLERDEGYRRALRLYRALDAAAAVVRPRWRDGVIDIPVAMPDDEIMVDRLHLDGRAQTVAWLAILEMTHSRGDLFTLQLHPERIFDCEAALRATLTEARRRRPAVWVARLDEIAAWWRRRRRATLSVRALDGGRYRVQLTGDADLTLLVRGMDAATATPWHGPDHVAVDRSFTVTATAKPVVGVSRRSPAGVLDFIREEGWPAEVSDDRERFGAFLDAGDEAFDEAGLLAEIEQSRGPLVRLWRWPGGTRSALAVTGDLDSITLQDFGLRLWETRPAAFAARLHTPTRAGAPARRRAGLRIGRSER